MVSLEEFQSNAVDWLKANADNAPPNYGAILPPSLVTEGVEWQKKLFASGWAGIHWPIEYGGQGLTSQHQSIWLEECARIDVPPYVNMVGCVLAGQGVQIYGTDQQKSHHLQSIITAKQLWCQLFSEPESGSDLGSLRTSAEADGEGWVVNGQKVWCSGGRYSDWGILMARTDKSLPKHRGISFFLVEMQSEGIETRPLRQMTGEAEFDEVFFTNVILPKSALLGPVNGGWHVGMDILTKERGSIGAGAITMQRRLDSLMSLAESELDAHTRQRLAMLLTQGKSYHFLGQRQGPDASVASSLNKLGITELMFDIANLRANIAGIEALLDGSGSGSLLSAPGARIAGGTSQIQRNIIGERILGLPKEPRPD
ncbi:MAG: acyl-CoA dehydrogenase family protein [Acidimicrobiales bacterium]|jgi:hypothetical protein|nr:acyl-CoA dehydrogenase family protein [Acidimicrobiales bacterium]MDP6298416.1 acyl-CoA dehydrogenase family protein [Acidimicrobiales bacterium]HJM27541.1 acyl-CoA dehydrogenase family protein [Acidimicrobiales bacterium]HJM98100.1 acyl-CoA dehydrogenase family protein [Acidimicrobiales bacterium]